MGRYSWFDDEADRQRSLRENAAAGAAYGGWLYGDGADGAVVLHDGDVLQPGFYTDLTIAAGATVTVPDAIFNVPVVHVSGTFTINGIIDLRGTDAVDRLSVGPSAALDENPGATGQAPRLTPLLSAPFVGGRGGSGSSGPPTEYGEPDPTGRTSAMMDTSVLDLMRLLAWAPAGSAYFMCDYGLGEAGSGDDTNYGGAGGAPGSLFLLLARHIVHGPDNLYLLQGGAGAPGGDDGTGSVGHGDCGGGGGAAGGWWLTVSDELVGEAGVTGTGGAGGQGCGSGTDGLPGMDGRGIHYLNRVS